MISPLRSRVAPVLALAAISTAGEALAQNQCVQLPPGAVAWWPADGTMDDLVGVHDAQDLGWGSPVVYAAGRVGQAFDLSGFDAALRVQDHADLDFGPTDDYSILLWLRSPAAASTVGQEVLVSKWRGFSQPHPYEFLLDADTAGGPNGTVRAVCWDETIQPSVRSTSTVDDLSFHHVAAVYRHPAMAIDAYVDGVLEATGEYAQPLGPLANSHDVFFGIRWAGANPISATNFDGRLDEIMIFGRSLSACEVDAVYRAGAEGVCRGDGDADGLPDYADNCPDDANAAQTDTDVDGVGDDCDCAPLNPAYGVVPPEVCALSVARAGTDSRLAWTSVSAYGGSGTRYDVLRGLLHELPVGTGGSEVCVQDDLDALEYEDTFVPAPGTGAWYLIRADSLCGDGSWGEATAVPRISPACS